VAKNKIFYSFFILTMKNFFNSKFAPYFLSAIIVLLCALLFVQVVSGKTNTEPKQTLNIAQLREKQAGLDFQLQKNKIEEEDLTQRLQAVVAS